MGRQVAGSNLYFTQRLQSEPGSAIDEMVAQSAKRFLVPTGQPFFLSDKGEYEQELNAFFRDLTTDGCHSEFTWKAYARDINSLLRFLHEVYRTHWLDATKQQLNHYRLVRRGPDAEQFGSKISGKSWNRALGAIDRLYCYAVEEGWIDKPPFKYK